MRRLAILAVLMAAGAAGACPVCSSETGQEVRAGLVDENLPMAVLGTILPFVVLGGVVAAVRWAPVRRGGRRD